MKVNEIRNKILDLEGNKIGIFKMVLVKEPFEYSYIISCQLYSKYSLEEIQTYVSTFKDKFEFIRIIKDIKEDNSYIMDILIKRDHELYWVIESEHSFREFYNNKRLTNIVCEIMKIKNILNLENGHLSV